MANKNPLRSGSSGLCRSCHIKYSYRLKLHLNCFIHWCAHEHFRRFFRSSNQKAPLHSIKLHDESIFASCLLLWMEKWPFQRWNALNRLISEIKSLSDYIHIKFRISPIEPHRIDEPHCAKYRTRNIAQSKKNFCFFPPISDVFASIQCTKLNFSRATHILLVNAWHFCFMMIKSIFVANGHVFRSINSYHLSLHLATKPVQTVAAPNVFFATKIKRSFILLRHF